MATVVENSKISPPPNTTPEFELPIVFFDMIWYDHGANQSVLFFDFPCTKSQFMGTIVPNLKKSLALTLSHFLPLAGNIIHPLNPGVKPVLRYEAGDSVCFTVSESTTDLNHLIGNHPRSCDDFYAFAPHLPPSTRSEKSISCPVLALQVTVFPGQGLCIGFVTHHAVADASTVVSFIQAWAVINRSRSGEAHYELRLAEANLLPFYDRKTVMNLNGLDSTYWDLIVSSSCPVEPPRVKLPINKIRATFVVKEEEIQKLKNLVQAMCPGVAHLSSFTVVCALFWVSSAKSAASAGEEVANDEPEYFGFVANCRGKLKPPLPDNYFGNCVSLVTTKLKHGEVKGGDGFVKAARAIGDAIKENVYNENKGILYGAEKWPEEYGKLIGKRQYGVAGSPRFDFYTVDYGWGKPKKFEALFIDGGGSMSLCKSEGGLEIGLSKPKVQMEAFSRAFSEVLHQNTGIEWMHTLTAKSDDGVIKPHAIMVEFLFQGHITPFIHLAVALASKGCTVTYVQTELNHHLMSKAQRPISIFLDLGLDIRCTTISDGFPLDFDRDLNFLEFYQSILRDFPARIDELVGKIIGGGSGRHFLVADTSYLWPPIVAAKHRIVNVSFWTSPAIQLSIGHHLELLKHNGLLNSYHDYKDELREIRGVKSKSVRDHMAYALTEDDPNVPQILKESVMKAYLEVKKAEFVLCNTVQELEPETILGLNEKLRTYAIGPTNFCRANQNITHSLRSATDCTEWLNTKPTGSVLLVSFGSLVQTEKEVILEIGHGLRISGVNFLWVIRPDAIDGDQDIPPGFMDDVGDRGLIVPWCNQREVLAHPAVGGFLTHCGWNSLLESMWFGVPLICYPIFMDQPVNRNLVVDDWKIGINLCDKAPLSREEVAKKVSNLMMSGSMRLKMKKVSKIVQNALAINGSSNRNLDMFLKDLKDKMISMDRNF